MGCVFLTFEIYLLIRHLIGGLNSKDDPTEN